MSRPRWPDLANPHPLSSDIDPEPDLNPGFIHNDVLTASGFMKETILETWEIVLKSITANEKGTISYIMSAEVLAPKFLGLERQRDEPEIPI